MKNSHLKKKVEDEDVVKKDGDEAKRSLLHSYVISHTHTHTHTRTIEMRKSGRERERARKVGQKNEKPPWDDWIRSEIKKRYREREREEIKKRYRERKKRESEREKREERE